MPAFGMRMDQPYTLKEMLPVETVLSSPHCSVESTCPDQLKAGDGMLMIQWTVMRELLYSLIHVIVVVLILTNVSK